MILPRVARAIGCAALLAAAAAPPLGCASTATPPRVSPQVAPAQDDAGDAEPQRRHVEMRRA